MFFLLSPVNFFFCYLELHSSAFFICELNSYTDLYLFEWQVFVYQFSPSPAPAPASLMGKLLGKAAPAPAPAPAPVLVTSLQAGPLFSPVWPGELPGCDVLALSLPDTELGGGEEDEAELPRQHTKHK